MKSFLLGFALIVVNVLSAQNFKFQYDNMHIDYEPQASEQHGSNRIENIGTTAETVEWTATVIFKPYSWNGVQVCDDKYCYPMADEVTRKFSLNPGTSGLFKVSMFSNGVDSCAMVKATAKKQGSDIIDDVSYYFYQNSSGTCDFPTAGVRQVSQVDLFKVFPNPATTFIQINNSERLFNLRIIDQNGRIINNIDEYNKEPIQINALVPGNYFIIYELHDGKVGMTKFIKY